MTTRRQPAANAVVVPEVVYLPDYHGAALLGALAGSTGAQLNRARAIVAAPQFMGWTKRVQQMKGQASLGAAAMGSARIYAPSNSEMNRETTTTDTGTASVFASRMSRGQQ